MVYKILGSIIILISIMAIIISIKICVKNKINIRIMLKMYKEKEITRHILIRIILHITVLIFYGILGLLLVFEKISPIGIIIISAISIILNIFIKPENKEIKDIV